MNINEFIDFIKCSKALEQASPKSFVNNETITFNKFENNLRKCQPICNLKNSNRSMESIRKRQKEKFKINGTNTLINKSMLLRNSGAIKLQNHLMENIKTARRPLKNLLYKGIFRDIIREMYKEIKLKLINRQHIRAPIILSGHKATLNKHTK